MFLIVVLAFIICTFETGSVFSASPTRFPDRRPKELREFQDSSVMANIIGSGGLNFQHYFYTLGVACENHNQGLWRNIDLEYKTCENSSARYRKRLPNGYFKKACGTWKAKRHCKVNLALNLDTCLGGQKGSDAFRFMDAYVQFTCGDTRTAEAHTVDRFTKRGLVVPGVFRCFPSLQDRISNCVKEDTSSTSFCSQFFTVHQCYGRYYTGETCNDPQSIVYMRDLFHSMSANLKCPQNQEDWYDKVYPGSPGQGLQPQHRDQNNRYIPTSQRPFVLDDSYNILSTRRPNPSEKPRILKPPISPLPFPNYVYARGRGSYVDSRFISSTRPPIVIDDKYIYIPTTERHDDSYSHNSKYNNNINGILRPVSARPYRKTSDEPMNANSSVPIKPELNSRSLRKEPNKGPNIILMIT